MTITKPLQNTFNRIGIDYQSLMKIKGYVLVGNRFGGGSCSVTPFIAYLINWVYQTSNKYEMGDYSVKVSDFDRVRYFVMNTDYDAYMTCLD